MIKILLMVLGVVGISAVVYGTNPNSFLITCTPVLTYSVAISTPLGGLTFPSVEINKTYVNTTTATIRNNGNVTADWKIKATALDTWTLGTAPGENIVRLLGVLKSSIASSDEFETDKDVITGTEGNMDNTNYTVDQTGNNVPVNGTRLLSIRLDSPTDSTVNVNQRFRVEIRAYPASEF